MGLLIPLTSQKTAAFVITGRTAKPVVRLALMERTVMSTSAIWRTASTAAGTPKNASGEKCYCAPRGCRKNHTVASGSLRCPASSDCRRDCKSQINRVVDTLYYGYGPEGRGFESLMACQMRKARKYRWLSGFRAFLFLFRKSYDVKI